MTTVYASPPIDFCYSKKMKHKAPGNRHHLPHSGLRQRAATGARPYSGNAMDFLPTTRQEMERCGWRGLDVLLITGDSYIDHPSFGIPLLGRLLERNGFKVGIVAQPDCHSIKDIARMGRPRLFAGVSSGTVDSMINNYTANKRKRSDDQYAPGGLGGKRPDYATTVYARLAREAFPDTPIVIGGVEASLRRVAHYDYWQNKVRPSILLDAPADLLVFGMGERLAVRIAKELAAASDAEGGAPVSLHDDAARSAMQALRGERGVACQAPIDEALALQPRLLLPSFHEVRDDKKKFARAALLIEEEANPYNGKRLVQPHGKTAVVVNPPSIPITTAEFDALYELPFTREQHPSYKERIPAAEMIQFSVIATRGCFGGCSFCAITLHHGRIVSSRTEESILKELAAMTKHRSFKGQVTDIGGPTANMWRLNCKSIDIQSVCRKLSCVHPKICAHLIIDHTPQVKLLEKARALPGIKKISIGSGLRYDIALADKKAGHKYLLDLIAHHVGGQLKVAPEHLNAEVLHLMKKPGAETFDDFAAFFEKATIAAKKEQYLVPYFISGFPGCTHEQMEEVGHYLQRRNWRVQQVQAFIPTPMTLATAMYYSGIDPATKQPLWVAREWNDRKIQQALLQPGKMENQELLRRTGYWYKMQGGLHARPKSGAARGGAKKSNAFRAGGPLRNKY